MTSNWLAKACGAAIFGVALVSSAAIARADEGDSLCLAASQRPEGDEDWGVACVGHSWGYATVRVHPTDEQDILDVHVTEHGECTDGSQMSCFMSTDLFHGICLSEGNYDGLEGGGFAPYMFLLCKCYTPEEPCEDVL
jgi:hypothetical protein